MNHSLIRRLLAVAAVVTLACAGLPSAAAAVTIEVRPLGPGFLPLQDALERARPGDVVVVGPGRYRERLEIPGGVTLRSSQGPSKTFLVSAGAGCTVLVRGADSLVVIEGFTFLGGATTYVRDRGHLV